MRQEQFTELPNFSYHEILNHFIGKGFSELNAQKEIEKVNINLMKTIRNVTTR